MESGLIAQSIKKGDEELRSIEKETSRHDKEKDEAGNRRYNYIDLLRKEADTWKILDISTNVSVAKLVII